MKKYLLLLFIAFAGTFAVQAQESDNLSEPEIEELRERTIQLITDFQGYLTEIGNKSNSESMKDYYIKSALHLFMGNGDSYYIDGRYHDPVIMEVSSLRNGITTVRPKPMKQYLQNLKRLRYTSVRIEKAETVRISNIYKVGDHYEGTAIFFQYFEGKQGERTVYRDKTKKAVKIYVVREDDDWGTHWNVKFGDIKVEETTAG